MFFKREGNVIIEGEEAVKINGVDYFLVKQFARITKRTEGHIRSLINKGNKKRKLKCYYVGEKPFIFVTELFEFPFLSAGRGNVVERFRFKNGVLSSYEEDTPE